MYSAVVGRVLALGQAAVLLHASFGDEFGVLLGDAVASFLIRLSIVRGPPVTQISVLIELAPLIVIPVDGLVPNHRAGGSIVDRVALSGIEEGRLQNPGRKIDGVGLGILISIHSGWRHSPFGSVHRLPNLLKLAVQFEGCGALHVGQMIVRANLESRVVAPVVGIPDLVNLGGKLHPRLLLGFWTHPVHGIDFLAQRDFERVHHLLDTLFAFRRKGSRYVGLPQRLSDVAVFLLNTSAPERLNLLRTEQGLSGKGKILVYEILAQ